MGKRLYVGGLSFRTTEPTLAEYFQQAGLVEAASIVMDRETGRSKGFGFVEMSSSDEARRAIELFDGREFDGRQLTVAEARPRDNRGPYATPGYRNGAGHRDTPPGHPQAGNGRLSSGPGSSRRS